MTLLPTAPFEPPYHACIFVDSRARGGNGFAERAEEMVKLAQVQPGFLGLDLVRDADGFGILVSYWRDGQSVTAWQEHAAHAAARGDGANRPWYVAFTVHVAKVERSYRPPQPTKRKNLSFPDRYALVRTLDEIHRLPNRENWRSPPTLAPSRRAVESVSAMLVWIRRLAPFVIAACVVLSTGAALGKTPQRGPLTGTWTGYIAGSPGSGVKRQQIRVVVNASETGGSWRISATCYGPLTLESISNGYHHFLRKSARGASCAGGDVDCLKRAGANVYDAVTSRWGGQYDISGTLRRVSS